MRKRKASDGSIAAAQPLRGHCRYVVAFGGQHIASKLAEIFVELQFHSVAAVGTGTMRSRATSAP